MTSNGAVNLNHSESPISSDSKVGYFETQSESRLNSKPENHQNSSKFTKIIIFVLKNTFTGGNGMTIIHFTVEKKFQKKFAGES